MQSAIRPFSENDVPEHINGHKGSNRAPKEMLQIPLSDDREAMAYFLEQYNSSAGTLRIYTRECERLALWAMHVKAKAISSLNVSDIEQYIAFLANPSPTELWCGPKAPKESEAWRPFVAGIDVNARLAALSAINSMMGYWVQCGYLQGNPLGLFRQLKQKIVSGTLDAGSSPSDKSGSKSKKRAAPVAITSQEALKVERYLDDEMLDVTMQSIEDMKVEGGTAEQNSEYERARFLVAMLFTLAPRISEIETHNMNSFRDEGGLWWWCVVGKGSKFGKVPVPDAMLQALVRYRKSLGMSAVPTPKDDSPLLRSVRHPGQPMTGRRLNQILKEIFKRAADKLPVEREHVAEKLRKASAHWGRHTSITKQIQSGMNHLHVQQNARHTKFSTTEGYIHDNQEKRHEDSQKLELPRFRGEN